jgi:hypothetical protein
MADAVREFRFSRRLENDVEAYRVLIRQGLESFERREEAGREPKGRKP